MPRTAAVLVLLLTPSLALADTYTVAADGSGEYATVQAAIDASVDGDTVEVGPGTYPEVLDFLGKDIAVVGTGGSAATVLDAEGSAGFAVVFANAETSAAVLSGFTIHNSGEQGVLISNAGPTFEDVVFEDLGSSAVYGGAVFVDNGTPSFVSCVFQDNVGDYGGHLAVAHGDISLEDTSFSGGSAAAVGGAVYLAAGASIVETGGSYSDNRSAGSGGAIYLESDAGLDLTDTDFSDNQPVDGNGAAIYAAAYNHVALNGGTFSGNSCPDYANGYNGGALYMYAGLLDVTGTTFDANYANYGGALYVDEGIVTLTDATFTTNYAYYGAAAFYYDNVTLTDTGGVYDTNTSYDSGAAVYGGSQVDQSYTDATFNENAAYYGYGGGIYAYYLGSVTLDNVLFEKNTAYYYGGGVYAYYLMGAVTATDCTFDQNDATNGYGGGIYAYDYSDVAVDSSSFTGNYAYYAGGAIYEQTDGNLTVANSEITANEARYQSGGGVYFGPGEPSYDLTFHGNTVSGNATRYEGGALFILYGGDLDIEDNAFLNNTLEDSSFGGAISASEYHSLLFLRNTVASNTAVMGAGLYLGAPYDDTGWTSLLNNVFSENDASRLGGGLVAISQSEFMILNNSFLGNQALQGGGAVYSYESAVDFRDNLVAFTVDGEAFSVSGTDAAAATVVSYNDFYENAAGDLGADLATATLDAETNIAADPELPGYTLNGDPDDDFYALAPTSPCVDAGDPGMVDADGSRADIGAYGGPQAAGVDADGDGYTTLSDCDDDDATVYPGATETWYDGVNTDCGWGSDYDQDGDGADSADWGGTDCDDADPTVIDCPQVDTGDSGGSVDTGDSAVDTVSDTGGRDTSAGEGTPAPEKSGGCGCAAVGGRTEGMLGMILVGLVALRRRRHPGS